MAERIRYPSVLQQLLLGIAYEEGYVNVEIGIEVAYGYAKKYDDNKKWQFEASDGVKKARACTRRALLTLQRKGLLDTPINKGSYVLTHKGRDFCRKIQLRMMENYAKRGTRRFLY